MIKITRIVYLVALTFGLYGCYMDLNAIASSDSAEKKYHENVQKKLVAFMSLETMFTDPQVRALAKAAGNGEIRTVNKLISEGVDVNSRGTGNATPLFWALRDIKGFTCLLELGADPNVIFNDGGSIMHWATKHNSEQFLIQLLNYGGNPNLVATINKRTPIFELMGPDHKERLPLLLKAGADINAQAGNGDTPIMVAAGLGQFDTVYYLLEQGAAYELKDNAQKTLMDTIAFRRNTIDPTSKGWVWMIKVIDWLEDIGVTIPEGR